VKTFLHIIIVQIMINNVELHSINDNDFFQLQSIGFEIVCTLTLKVKKHNTRTFFQIIKIKIDFKYKYIA
jgi:hypothetical protein